MRALWWLGLGAGLVACSDGTTQDDTDAAGDTDLVQVDTDLGTHDTDETPGDTDVEVPACPLPADFGAFAPFSSDAEVTDNGLRLSIRLTDDAEPDLLNIELYGSTPTFSGAPQPGTYELTGADLNYATCGVCLLLLTDVTDNGPVEYYFPTSGTVTLTETATGIHGSLADVVFARVTIDSDTFVSTVLDECTTTLSAAGFGADFPL